MDINFMNAVIIWIKNYFGFLGLRLFLAAKQILNRSGLSVSLR